MRAMLVAVAVVVTSACGGHPPIPRRAVVEGDLGSWKFKRFQGPMLDAEVWIEGNKAEAFTASYITADAEKRGHIDDKDLVNVVVTRYERDDGIVRATVKLVRRLAAEAGYQVEEDKIGGIRAVSIVGHGEAWVIWPSTKHVVKVGGRGLSNVPSSMVSSYADRYPSRLPGGALEGPLPAGPDDAPKKVDKPEYDPNNPQIDLDKYDPKKVKIPERTVEPEPTPDDPKPDKKKQQK